MIRDIPANLPTIMSPSLRTLSVTLAVSLTVATTVQRTTNASTHDDDLVEVAAWLQGHWIGDGLGGENETLWSPPRAGTMMGVFRHMKEGEVVFYELLALVPEDGVLVLKLKHFDPGLNGWEAAGETVDFPLIRAEEDALYFDGMMYRRVGPDEREVTVMLGPDEDNLRPEIFTYRRVGS